MKVLISRQREHCRSMEEIRVLCYRALYLALCMAVAVALTTLLSYFCDSFMGTAMWKHISIDSVLWTQWHGLFYVNVITVLALLVYLYSSIGIAMWNICRLVPLCSAWVFSVVTVLREHYNLKHL